MLDQLLTNILREANNTTVALDAIGKAVSGSDETITFMMVDAAGNETEYTLPSLGYLLSKLEKIEGDFKAISSGDERTVYVRNTDGTYRRLIKQSVPHDPPAPTSLSIPSNFTFKSNKQVYDGLIDPLLAVSIDMGQVDESTRRFLVKKIVVDASTQADKDAFSSIFSGRNNISHSTVYDNIKTSSLEYYESVQELSLELKVLDGSGSFSVTGISKVKTTEVVGDQTFTKYTYVYTLNTLDYTDNISKGSLKTLKVGDHLVLNTGDKSTRYKVLTVDTSTNQITAKLAEGFGVIGIGTDVLEYSGKFVQNTKLNIPVGYDERVILFFKSIDEGYGHASGNWSDGIAFYSNDLIIPTTGGSIDLPSFYKDYVADVGRVIREIAGERKVPITSASTPDAPTLNDSDFNVLEINSHKKDVSITNQIVKKNAEKVSIKSQLAAVDKDIQVKKNEISTKSFRNAAEKLIEEENLSILRNKRSDLASLQESIVDELSASIQSARTYTPKYRVRGFWAMPQTKYLDEVNEIGPQDVIGFIVQYRYLSESGQPEPTQTIEYQDTTGQTKNGSFSRWNEYRSPIRKKTVSTDGTLVWKTEKPQNAEEVNINQIDIPITKGEQVEIRVKSISEVGYPTNPLESDWSESIIVTFPEDLDETNPIADIEKTQQEDSLGQKFKKELVSLGLDSHTSDSITIGDLTFSHQSTTIASTEKTPENRPKSVQDILDDHKSRIAYLEALISGASGEMEVTILDDSGTEIQKVTNSQTVKLFAGYYTDEIADASVKKGEIVNKLYYIQISNLSDADLELLSYVPGSYLEAVPDNTYTGFVIDQNQFNNYRQYWKVPVSLRGYINNQELYDHHNSNTDPFINVPTFASRQSKGQFLYSRYTDISLNNALYNKPASVTDEAYLPIQSGGSSTAYVWNYSGAATGNGDLTNFCVHTDHPDIQSGTTLITNLSALFTANGGLPNTNLGASTVYYPYFMHSAYFNLQENETNGTLQLEYIQHQKSGGTPALADFPRKLHFTENDKYLIGKNTCGSYLSILPEDHDFVSIDGTLYNDTEVIKKSSNSVRIPVLFSYRMTDYDGTGSSGTGVVGGYGASVTNLRYRKKIGIDIQQFDSRLFSFDIEVYAQYKKEGAIGL